MDFSTAVKHVLMSEGGYVDHPLDPGRKTNFGITESVAREEGYKGDMRQLPLDLAKRIYKTRFWDKVRADELPPSIRYAVFDAAVNSGVRQSILWLQRAAGVSDDGVIGPKTLTAVHALNADALRMRILAQRLRFLTNLNTFGTFGRGWTRRVCDLMET
jgi:lysozyme family protein